MPVDHSPLTIDANTRIAILAGGGELPLLIAESVKQRGGHVHIVGIKGEADTTIEAYPHTWVNFAEARRMFAALKGVPPLPSQNVMVIAGAVKRPDLKSLRPDAGFVGVVFELLALISAGGDDALLTKAIRMFERRGLTVVGVQDVAPELLIGEGVLGAMQPDDAALQDIDLAREVLDLLGDLDVGQGAVVESGRVLAIEGIEGTDAMLARIKATGMARRAVLLKAPKPGQERRIDLPTIGVRTVTNANAAGIRGVAVIAGESLGLQRDAMAAAADTSGMFVLGLPPRQPATPNTAPRFQVDVISARQPRLTDMADAERGAAAVLRLKDTSIGQTTAVVRRHVLGVTAADTPFDLFARLRRPWGRGLFKTRRGAVVVRAFPHDTPHDAAAIARATADAGFAALVFVVGMRDPHEPLRLALSTADAHNIALISLRCMD